LSVVHLKHAIPSQPHTHFGNTVGASGRTGGEQQREDGDDEEGGCKGAGHGGRPLRRRGVLRKDYVAVTQECGRV